MDHLFMTGVGAFVLTEFLYSSNNVVRAVCCTVPEWRRKYVPVYQPVTTVRSVCLSMRVPG